MSSSPVLHYECRGNLSAPPVVFLHGFLGSGKDWAEVIDLLSSLYCCITIDLPGHGQSVHFTDDQAYTVPGAALGVVGAMNKAGVGPAPIVGYSMGGRLALNLAIHYGHVCSCLVIESATAGIPGEEDRMRRLALDENHARALEHEAFEDFLRTWYCQPVFATLMDDAEKLEAVLHRRRANEPAELARALRGMSVGAQASLWEVLPRLDIPVCLVAGEMDGKYVNLLREMGALLPHATVEMIPGVGHNVHLENPSAMAKQIQQFLQGVGKSYGDR